MERSDGGTRTQLEIRGPVRQRRPWIWLTTLALVLMGGGAGAWAYTDYYRDLALPHTLVGELNVEGKTPSQLRRLLQSQCRDLRVVLSGVVQTELSLSDLGLSCDVPGTAAAVFSPNSSLGQRLKSLVMQRQVSARYTLDNAVLIQTARRLSAPVSPEAAAETTPEATAQTTPEATAETTPEAASQEPQQGAVRDPRVSFDSATESFVIQAGEPGLGIDPEVLRQAAVETWKNQQNTEVSAAFTVVSPLEPPAEMSRWVAQANQLISPSVKLIGRGRAYQIEAAEKARWISFESGEAQLDAAQVTQWVEQFAAERINTPSSPGEKRLTKDGRLLQLTKMAWATRQVSNAEQIAAELSHSLREGKDYRGVFQLRLVPGVYNEIPTEQEVPVPYQAAPGEKWISVDLTHATTTAFEGDKIVIGPVESVNGSLPSPTLVGKFRVQSKHALSRMQGNGWDGEYDVNAPWVMYYYRDYALHGSPWRYNWVQTNYGGSHGCTNLPVASAEEFYRWASVGTPVIVHRPDES